MEQELIQTITKHLGVWEAVLTLALVRCLLEIRTLYRTQLEDKERARRELQSLLADLRREKRGTKSG